MARLVKAGGLIRSKTYTVWLFVFSNLKDTWFPCVALSTFAALSGPVLGFDPRPSNSHILTRLPIAGLWAYVVLLMFCIHNQCSPKSVQEDAVNKPWRPIPAGRITVTGAHCALAILYPITLLFSFWVGGSRQLVAFTLLSLWYNQWGGSDASGILRNFLNAAGYACLFSGTLEVHLGPAYDVFNPKVAVWLFFVVCIIFTTIHAQDFRDEAGDRLRGRRTIQSAIGVPASQWTIITAVLFWSIFIPAWLELRFSARILPYSTGSFCIFVLILGFLERSPQRDLLTYKAWCVWLWTILLLPWLKLAVAGVA